MSEQVTVVNPTATGQATSAKSISVVMASDGPAIPVYAPAVVALLDSTPVITANANSSNISVGSYVNLAIDIAITAVSGTSPTIQFYIDRLSADGSTWNPIWSSGMWNAIGTLPPISLGPGAQTPHIPGNTIRIRYVVGGTTPSFTLSIGIYGKA